MVGRNSLRMPPLIGLYAIVMKSTELCCQMSEDVPLVTRTCAITRMLPHE